MTTTENGAALAVRTPGRIGQATAVEQSRAVAEVEAAVIVAQRCPRNTSRAIAEMRDSCRRRELAEKAFFRFPKGGGMVSGPSIHLARELARIWGNIQWGLHELRRDDEHGQSEMLAYAWDVQANSRTSSIVINPHRLYTGGGGKQLTELRDIYDNNANVGSRRVREAIFGILPSWFVDEAIELCSKTNADGGGVPLPKRIANAIEVFGNLGITVPQLETKLGAKSDKWTDQDVAQLRIIRASLLRGEIRKEDEFPAPRITAADITAELAAGEPEEAPEPPARPARTGDARQAGKAALDRLADLLGRLDLGPEEDVTALIHRLTSPDYSATRAEVDNVTSYLEDHLRQCGGDTDKAAAAICDLDGFHRWQPCSLAIHNKSAKLKLASLESGRPKPRLHIITTRR